MVDCFLSDKTDGCCSKEADIFLSSTGIDGFLSDAADGDFSDETDGGLSVDIDCFLSDGFISEDIDDFRCEERDCFLSEEIEGFLFEVREGFLPSSKSFSESLLFATSISLAFLSSPFSFDSNSSFSIHGSSFSLS